MSHKVIVIIVERGKADAVVEKAVGAGAPGATIFYGRGAGEHTFPVFKNLQIEPAKELIVIVVPARDARRVLDVAAAAAKVGEKGRGIAFALPITDLVGAEAEYGG